MLITKKIWVKIFKTSFMYLYAFSFLFTPFSILHAGPNVPILSPVTPLTPATATAFLQSFKNQQIAKNIDLKITLKPPTKQTQFIPYKGTAALKSQKEGLEGDLILSNTTDTYHIHFVQGPHPLLTLKQSDTLRTISINDWLKPLLPQCPYTAFELLMPFIYWDGTYKTTQRMGGRIVHTFLMTPPDTIQQLLPEIQQVLIEVDAGFFILKKAELWNNKGQKTLSLSVDAFKKIKDMWMIKELTSIHYPEKAKCSIFLEEI